MTYSADACFDASWVDHRRAVSRVKGRALRGILSGSIVGLGAVAALGTAAVAVTLAAGWMASSAVEPRVHLPGGPASLALVPYDPSTHMLARGAASSWSTAYIDRSKPLISGQGRRAVAAPTTPPVRHAMRPAAIPMPRPLPARLAHARAELDKAPVIAKALPQVEEPAVQQVAAAPAAKPIAKPAPQVMAIAIPTPPARPEIKQELTANPEVAAKPQHASKIEKMASLDTAAVEPKAVTAPRLSAPASIPAVMPGSVSRTAVYDIADGIVHMPDGSRLEAHSGMGEKMDDPRYIRVRMRGPTPPNVYVLTEREALFHGVRAVRLNPVDRSRMFGRDGMLAHTYMIGPTGQSNGCVSFKDYNKFLTAFLDGKVDKMVVVTDLKGTSWKTAALQAEGVSASPRRYAGGYSRPRIFPAESDSGPRYTSALAYGSERGAGNW